MMNKLPVVEMVELNNHIVSCDTFQNRFSIADADGNVEDTPESHEPMRFDAWVLLLATEGTMEIRLDYVPYTVRPNSFVMIMPTHVMQLEHISADFKGRMLIASREFLTDCDLTTGGSRPHTLRVSNYMEMRKNPCTELEPEEVATLDTWLKNLREKIRDEAHHFQREIIQNMFVVFLLELGNIFLNKNSYLVRSTLSRKEELFEQFLQLLFEHFRVEHAVTFYADKLFITPQYLSLILKELTGMSANKWIDDALVAEAKVLLKAPQMTVQQVADQLHFSDQSTFGKFFKKHMGISPMEYRRS